MFRSFLQFSILILLIAAAHSITYAQADTSSPDQVTDKTDIPKNIQESLAKQRIEREKKDFQELLDRGEEALQLSDELEKSYTKNNQLSAEDQKKLDRLEKVVKKIRNELGGDDDKETVKLEDQPLSVVNALKYLQNNTVKLVDELKKTTRYSVSVVAVESSNMLLKVVRFIRFNKK